MGHSDYFRVWSFAIEPTPWIFQKKYGTSHISRIGLCVFLIVNKNNPVDSRDRSAGMK
jgi:hypothetical protein